MSDSARTETFTLEQSLPSERLDKFLTTRYPAVSRNTLQRLIEEGHIRVNGAVIKPTHKPHAGEIVTVTWPVAKPALAQPENIQLDVLHEDADLLLINKPAGMATHPGAGHEEHTLVNALLHHCAGQLSGVGGVARPGIVHRLDLDTTGVLVVAKNDVTHLALQKQFATRTTNKIYLALVCGNVANDTGSIRAPIARHPYHRKKMTVRDEGRDALTTFRVTERLGPATLVEVKIHTGRTHQIRVHFLHVGYPVVGDETYGAKSGKALAELTGYTAPRQLLHAHRLTFVHPTTNEEMTFEAPVPADFEEALRALRRAKAPVTSPGKSKTTRH